MAPECSGSHIWQTSKNLPGKRGKFFGEGISIFYNCTFTYCPQFLSKLKLMSNDRICAHKLFNSSNTRADWVTCQLNTLCSNRFKWLEIPDGCDYIKPKNETFIHLVICVLKGGERFAVCKPSHSHTGKSHFIRIRTMRVCESCLPPHGSASPSLS